MIHSIIFWLLFAIGTNAESDFAKYAPKPTRVINNGHNVTQTAYLYPQGRCTAGNLLVGCGLTDETTIATSPWLISNYNMTNIMVRQRLDKSDRRETALQLGYFKTFSTGESYAPESDPNSPSFDPTFCPHNEGCSIGYEMEALWTYYLSSHRLTPEYTFHWNADVAYYWNDKKPFSLRRPQAWKSPWQLNAMTLHEVHLIKNFYMEGEIGILGLTEKYPAFHSGATLSYRGSSWGLKFGMSATGSIHSWFKPFRRDVHHETLFTREGLDREFSEFELQHDFSIHPEIAIQYFFDI